jgi:SAM-dependent methyltransferase
MIEDENEWDRLLKIKTSGRDDSNAGAECFPYEPTPYAVLERLANSGYIRKKNVLIDYGCGKGRVSFYLSYQIRCRAIGIEYDKRIFGDAIANKESGVYTKRTSFINTTAQSYEVDNEADRMFFFHPFSVTILEQVIEKIAISQKQSPREILLIFYYPFEDYRDFIKENDQLTIVEEISTADFFDENDKRECLLIVRMEKK